jgi:TonB family protein
MLTPMRGSNYLLGALAFMPLVVLADKSQGLAAYEASHYAEAVEQLKPVAEKGDAEAQHKLGLSMRTVVAQRQGDFKPLETDPQQQESTRWLQKAAQQGYVPAMVDYGIHLSRGIGVDPDFQAAREWAEKGAAGGDINAMAQLSMWYRDGFIVAPDDAKSDEWFARVARNGGDSDNIWALIRQASKRQRQIRANLDPNREQRLLAEAQGGSADAAMKLARDASLPQAASGACDRSQAARWFDRAGDLGDRYGYQELAEQYFHGRCQAQDFAKARLFYTKAADGAVYAAMKALGYMALFGHGQPVDYAEAYRRLRLLQVVKASWIEKDPAPLNFARRKLTAAQIEALEKQINGQGAALLALDARAAAAKIWRREIARGGDSKDPNKWSFSLGQVDDSGFCAKSPGAACEMGDVDVVLEVHNPEPVTLACQLNLAFEGLFESKPVNQRFIVRPNSDLARPLDKPRGMKVSQSQTTFACERVAKPSVATSTCALQTPPDADPSQFYPEDLKERQIEGRVVIVVTLPAEDSLPARVDVRTSSGTAGLDSAAVAFAKATKFKTNCPNEGQPIAVAFQL